MSAQAEAGTRFDTSIHKCLDLHLSASNRARAHTTECVLEPELVTREVLPTEGRRNEGRKKGGGALTSAKGSPASMERGSAEVKYQWKGDTWRGREREPSQQRGKCQQRLGTAHCKGKSGNEGEDREQMVQERGERGAARNRTAGVTSGRGAVCQLCTF